MELFIKFTIKLKNPSIHKKMGRLFPRLANCHVHILLEGQEKHVQMAKKLMMNQ